MTYTETNGLHSAPDEMASEFEVHGLLYSLVRLLKPKVCIETGCYKGHASEAIAQALSDNKAGYLVTCDTNFVWCETTQLKTAMYGDYITVRDCTGVNLISKYEDGPEKIDFAFLDSSGDRVAECAALQLSPKGVVVLHDSKREQYKPIWTMRPWASIWEIDTPRGITVFVSK